MNVDWEKLEGAFARCYELEGAARKNYLQELEQNEPDLFFELQKLLDADDQAAQDSFFEPGAIHRAELLETKFVGQTIGTFTLTELIGEGGMGAVYRAEQTKPFKRVAAVKVIRVHNTNERLQRRFDLEVQTLARLNHPNIASVYFSGTTDEGFPYFAMELIDGLPFDDYCREHNLDVPARLQLFAKTCRAVHFAHQRGVIHRDLKPANILVTEVDGEPQPKIIDFGIAKAVQNDNQGEHSFQVTASQLTMPGMAVGTLGYMSPEQTLVHDHDVDLRTDVFSLGVILYEILVGDLPLGRDRLANMSWDEIYKAIREALPKIPSRAVLTHGTMSGEPDHEVALLSKQYRGDIDWMVMKAVEKDPDRRYETALAFAEDCDRHLAHEPVTAGPPSLSYQLNRFVKRNKLLSVAVVAVAAAFLLGFVGLGAGFYQAKQAEKRMQQEIDSANTTIGIMEELISSVSPRNEGSDVKVVDRLEAFAPGIETLDVSEEIRGNLHFMVGRAFRTVDRRLTAKEHLTKSLAIRKKVYGSESFPAFEARYALIITRQTLDSHEEVIPDMEALLNATVPDLQNSESLANLNILISTYYARTGHPKEAEKFIRSAHQLLKTYPPPTNVMTVKAYNTEAGNLTVKGDHAEAVVLLERALALNDGKGRNKKYLVTSYSELAEAHNSLGNYKLSDSYAEEATQRALALFGPNHETYFNIRSTLMFNLTNRGVYGKVLNLAGEIYGAYPIEPRKRDQTLDGVVYTAGWAAKVAGEGASFYPFIESYFDATYQHGRLETRTLFDAKQLNMLGAGLIGIGEHEAALGPLFTAQAIWELRGGVDLLLGLEISENLAAAFEGLKQTGPRAAWACTALDLGATLYGAEHPRNYTNLWRWVVAVVKLKEPGAYAELEKLIEKTKGFYGEDSAMVNTLLKFRDKYF